MLNISNIKVCIVGLGFVGNAMYESFKNKDMIKNINLFLL